MIQINDSFEKGVVFSIKLLLSLGRLVRCSVGNALHFLLLSIPQEYRSRSNVRRLRTELLDGNNIDFIGRDSHSSGHVASRVFPKNAMATHCAHGRVMTTQSRGMGDRNRSM